MVPVLSLEELQIIFHPKSCMYHLFLLFVYDLKDSCILILEIFYRNHTRLVWQLINHVIGNQMLLIDLSLKLQKPHHCQRFFSMFQLTLLSSAKHENTFESHIDIEIIFFQNMAVIVLSYTFEIFDKMLTGL